MVVDHALRVARRARRVVERGSPPLVRRRLPRVRGVAAREQRLVVEVAQEFAARTRHVGDVDDADAARRPREGRLDDRRELRARQQHARLAVVQHERQRLGVEARVERVEHAARHRDAEVRLDHLGRVREHRRDGVPGADSGLRKRRREPPGPFVHLRPGEAAVAVDDRDPLRPDAGGPREEGHRRQRRVVAALRSRSRSNG